MLSAWRRVAGQKAQRSPGAALEIARGLGAGRLIDGSVVGTPEHLTITASLLPLPLAARAGPRERRRAGRQSPGVGGPARRTSAQPRGGSGSLPALLVTSSSLPATRAFLAGRAALRKGDMDEAFRQLPRGDAFSIRPSRWRRWSWCMRPCGSVGRGVRMRERGKRLAQAGRDRLGPGDQALLDAWDMDDITGPEWIQAGRRPSRANPDRAETWYELGDAYFHNGALVGLDDPCGSRPRHSSGDGRSTRRTERILWPPGARPSSPSR